MKKILTLLTFIFLSSEILLGQTCPDTANGNGNGRTFNMTWSSTALAQTVLDAIESVTVPGWVAGTTETRSLLNISTLDDGRGRLKPPNESTNTFGGQNPFTGDIVFNITGGATLTCSYIGSDLSASVLPVDLISFKGKKKDRQISLTWKTASEINNEGFEIQKSNDGIAWDVIDFVEGNKTASVVNNYTSMDRFPTQGSNYYRLRQMDIDGRSEYSNVVVVDFNNRLNDVELFPNPAKDRMTLINGKGEAIIYNAMGQAVKQFTIDANQATIQLDELLNGQYTLQLLQEDGTFVTKQFTKVD